MSDTFHDILVIGAGVSGLAATREVLRAGLTAAYMESNVFGGLILNVNELDGKIQGSGAEYASHLMNEVFELGGEGLEVAATSIAREGDKWVVNSDTGRHLARAVIVASGASRRRLDIPGESELEHRGVSHCADCDGPLFHGKNVVVVGGGDSALQAVIVLAKYCERVLLVHRSEVFRAKPHLLQEARDTPQIEFRLNSEVSEVLGRDAVEGVRVNDEVIDCTGFFAFIGLEPASNVLPSEVKRDARGALLTSADYETNLPRLFAAGIVRAGCGGMVEHALAEGVGAGRAAANKLAVSV